MSIDNEQEINEKKLNKIKYEILKLEDKNSKTKDFNDYDMAEQIKKIIKDGVDSKL